MHKIGQSTWACDQKGDKLGSPGVTVYKTNTNPIDSIILLEIIKIFYKNCKDVGMA